jgi:hypothetical protein
VGRAPQPRGRRRLRRDRQRRPRGSRPARRAAGRRASAGVRRAPRMGARQTFAGRDRADGPHDRAAPRRPGPGPEPPGALARHRRAYRRAVAWRSLRGSPSRNASGSPSASGPGSPGRGLKASDSAGPGGQWTWPRSGSGGPRARAGAGSLAHSESLPRPFGGVPKSHSGIEARLDAGSFSSRVYAESSKAPVELAAGEAVSSGGPATPHLEAARGVGRAPGSGQCAAVKDDRVARHVGAGIGREVDDRAHHFVGLPGPTQRRRLQVPTEEFLVLPEPLAVRSRAPSLFGIPKTWKQRT